MTKILLLLLLGGLHSASFAQEPFTVVIDPGHGGFDPGAMGNQITEKKITLQYALEIGRRINQADDDIQVVYTRTKDLFIPLHKRTAIAREHQADLFVSIHVNSFTEAYVRGLDTYVMGMHTSEENLELAKKENAVILIEENYQKHYAGFDPNSSESYIIFDLIQEEYLLNSAEFSIFIQNNVAEYTSRKARGTKQAGFLVLKEANTPSVLVELGYLTNKEEAKYLLSDKGKGEITRAIAQAVVQYKQASSPEVKSSE